MGGGGGFDIYRDMNHATNFHFRYVGKYDTAEINAVVETLPAGSWDVFTYRQDNIIGHAETLTIPIIFNELPHARKLAPRFYAIFDEHLAALSGHLKGIGESHVIRRANLVMLPAGCSIGRHKDCSELLQVTRRFHLPLSTNPGCVFEVGGEEMHIPPGEVWEIDNTGKMHSVRNDGPTDRTHLIIDVS